MRRCRSRHGPGSCEGKDDEKDENRTARVMNTRGLFHEGREKRKKTEKENKVD